MSLSTTEVHYLASMSKPTNGNSKDQKNKYAFREVSPHDIEMRSQDNHNLEDAKHDLHVSQLHKGFSDSSVIKHVLHKPQRNKGERKDFHQKLFKTPKEATEALIGAAQKKVMIPMDKLMILGFLSGVFIAFGGIFAISVTMGLPNADPGVKKGLLAVTFPIALALIVYFGGELFTGNTMLMILGMLNKKVSWKGLTCSWLIAFFSNFAGAVFGAYFFGYLTELFAADPYLSNVQAIAVTKSNFAFHVAFLRAVAANWLVNLAIYVAIVAEDVGGKTITMFLIIGTFAVSGFEHSIANMFYVTLSLMYGANSTFGIFLYKNLIPVTLGNIVGGAIMAFALWYIYNVKQDINRPGSELFSITCLV